MSKLPLRYWKTPRYKRLKKKLDREIKAECKKIETREGFQAACWNYLYKKRHPKLLREFKKGR